MNPSGLTDKTSEDWLPFSGVVLRQIELLGEDPAEIVRRYQSRTKGKRIKDRSAYLLTIARDAAAKKLGTTPEILKMVTSSDFAQRTEALIAATTVNISPKTPKASASLIAQINRGRSQ